MSDFSAVDRSSDPASLVTYLDRSAQGLAAMKAYMAAAVARAVPGGRVLDLGCGAGHDVGLLADAGLAPVGLDPSWVMVEESRRRVACSGEFVQGDGAALPFGPAAFDGCRIERVLQHVDDPAAVLAEVARVVRPGGFLAVFEPDWTSWRVEGEVGGEEVARHLGRPRQPDIGWRLPDLVASAGFEVNDVVTEASVVRSLSKVPIDVESSLVRALGEGRVDPEVAERWLAEQRRRDAEDAFVLYQSKILVVAHRA